MCSSARVFTCARCRRQVVICSHCDRGNRYCGPSCAHSARRHAQREAAQRYQRTRRGRFAHAARQRRYRQRANVTHQGSAPRAAEATLPPTSGRAGRAGAEVGAGYRCHRCGRPCSPFLRLGFLRRGPTSPALPLPPPRRAGAQAP